MKKPKPKALRPYGPMDTAVLVYFCARYARDHGVA